MLLEIRYPRGEVAVATGYPVEGSTVVVDVIPRGPEAAYRDEVFADFTKPSPYPVTRIVAGPRRPTVRVRVSGSAADRDRWLDAREADGWLGRTVEDTAEELYLVAERDGLDKQALVDAGAELLGE